MDKRSNGTYKMILMIFRHYPKVLCYNTEWQNHEYSTDFKWDEEFFYFFM